MLLPQGGRRSRVEADLATAVEEEESDWKLKLGQGRSFYMHESPPLICCEKRSAANERHQFLT